MIPEKSKNNKLFSCQSNHFHGEKWKSIPGFPDYEVSDLGRVRSLNYRRKQGRVQVLKPATVGSGYLQVSLHCKGRCKQTKVHALVMLAFVGPRPKGYVINHLNGDKTDNRRSNLEYCSPSENMRHACEILGHSFKGERNPNSKLDADAIRDIRRAAAYGLKQCSLAKRFEVSEAHISNIVHRRTWVHLNDEGGAS